MRFPILFFLALVIPVTGAPPSARITAYLNTSPVARSSFIGIRILDLDRNAVVFERNAQRLFLPASNAKLFSTALALLRLGPEYHFVTRVEADRAPDAAGCVDSLRLVGGGDPNLSGRAIPYSPGAPAGNPLQAIEDLADRVTARGVRCVNQGIIGDDTAYVWEPYPDGWDSGDTVWDYGAAVSALSINDSSISVTILPGAHLADPAYLILSPPLAYYQFDNRVRTGGGSRQIIIDRSPGSRQVTLRGSLPVGGPGDTEVLGIDDPALYAATALRDALARRGVMVRGETAAVHLYPSQIADLQRGSAPDPLPGVELALRESAPLLEDLRITDKVSQNLHAEMALLAVARARRHIGSREAGLAELDALLGDIGVDHGEYKFSDGSGLSRMDLVAPDAIVGLLAYLYRSRLREEWMGLLPVAGQDGTLHARFLKSPAAGRIRAKTGSLSHVAALSGYARREDGAMLAFSILVNNYIGPESDMRIVIDRICELMIQ